MSDITHPRRRAHGRGREFALPGARKHYPPDLELEPVHLAIDLHLDLRAETCAGSVTTTLQARRAGVTRLELDAVSFSDLALRDPAGREVAWTYDGAKIAVEWAEPYADGERRELAVGYRVAKPAAGLYFSQPSDAYPEQPWFALTDHETERARHWLPCIDQPNARPRLDLRLRAEDRFTILANGALVEEVQHGDGTKTAHWRLDFPCPSYLTCLAVGDFVRADDGEHAGAPIAYFGPAGSNPDDLRRSFGRTGAMLDWMARKLDMPFPFPKYFQIAAPGVGGAMENISLVTWDDAFVLDRTLAAEWTRLVDEINLHEMAHSYFGDAVVCRDYAHAWLKESWATYMEQVWFEECGSRDEQLYQYYRDAQAYLDEADKRYQRPLVTRTFSSSWDMYDAHLYPGGACRLHTLRSELGDEVFWPAVRDYLRQYAGRVVETEDFRRVLEAHSGRSLVQWFEQWLHTAGYPAVRVTFRYDAKRREGTFEIEQTQVAKGKKKDDKDGAAGEQEPFLMRTDVGWVLDGRAHTWPVELRQAKHTVIVPMAADPQQVRFDPLHKVLHRLEFNPGDDKLRAQLTGAPDVIGRILAGRELAKTGKRANIEAVAAAYRAEPFWGVRAWWARALGEAGVEAAIEALVELVGWEQDPLALEPLVRACGAYRDPRARKALEARLDAGLPYYRATAAALEGLGAQRHDAPLERLKRAAVRPGYGGHVQSAALRALAQTRREEVVPLLLAQAAYGAKEDRARPAAVGALGTFARLAERPVRQRLIETLADLLRDPMLRVRSAAVGALQTAEAAEAISALDAHRAALAHQDQVRLDRAVRAIRDAQTPKTAAADKALEELREQLRTLRDQVEKLQARVDPDAGAAGAERPAAVKNGEDDVKDTESKKGQKDDNGKRDKKGKKGQKGQKGKKGKEK